MAVTPVPCACGGGGSGEPGEACCAPSITSTLLCRPDGTSVLLVARSGCTGCGSPPAVPEIVGWLDPASGAFTPGPAPEDAGPCDTEDCASVTLLSLCDQNCAAFLRHLVHDCAGAVISFVDTAPDGVTPYTPVGTVGDCADCQRCEREPMCPGFVGLTGPETWTIPPATESVSLSVACGPVTVYPCAGATDGVQINECGVSLQWAAPGTECRPGVLCAAFRIEVPEGSAVYVSWLSAGCGDES
ncbi:hypothetical protein ABT301_29530 [Streptomyces sp. NPDC000987]|uniref:hypothetical protein n=1 Tax=Streptomyces sp. NPDC000987 TaxID=3154374 RepID=UPI00331CFFFF